MSKNKETFNLVWFTNNLRTVDNRVLQKAIQSNKPVIACYCFDPRHFKVTPLGHKKTERYRAKFLIESVNDLKIALNNLNIPLFVYHDYPEQAISKLSEQFNIANVYTQKEFTSEEIHAIENIKRKINLVEIFDQFLYEPSSVLNCFDSIPKVFTEFRKRIEKQLSIEKCIDVKKQLKLNLSNQTVVPNLSELGFSDFHHHIKSAFPFKGGESEAKKRLSYYVLESKKIGFYKKTRNGLVGIDYSSKFSPWLANGCISARTIYWTIKEFEQIYFKNQSTYWLVFELIWRDFFKYIALQHGNAIFQLNGISNKNYTWRQDKVAIEAWKTGTTPDNFVNANMIELNKTGWMSNRGRQNVASYFAKTLELDWRVGASYFESLLIDYDVHSNYGNWLYVAGVGNDPRDRAFNTKLQANRYDLDGKFQKLWLQTELFT